MRTEEIRDALLDAIEPHLAKAVTLRHDLHAHPELGNEEQGTAARIRQSLAGSVQLQDVATTGVVARIGPSDVTGVALRAELDALPMTEATGASYSATNGLMHACGHDVHMAALVAVCRAAADVGVSRTLVGIFQPSEERYPSGAQRLVADGVLDDHQVGAILAVHLHPQPAAGAVAIGDGAINASSDEFEILIEGDGGHGAYPHKTRDPVLALAQVIVSLQHIVSRRVDPLHNAVIGVGTIHADGAANIIPSEARASGTLRCLQPADREPLQEMIGEVIDHTARSHGCQAQVTFTQGEPALINSPPLLRHVERELDPARLHTNEPMRSCGADDFGFYSEVAPSAMLFLGIGNDASAPGLHHPGFLPPDETVASTARALIAAYVGGCAFLDDLER